MPNGTVWRVAVAEKRRLALKRQPTVVRECLCCELPFRSSGIDHRLCNPCKGVPHSSRLVVGARLSPMPQVGAERWECCPEL